VVGKLCVVREAALGDAPVRCKVARTGRSKSPFPGPSFQLASVDGCASLCEENAVARRLLVVDALEFIATVSGTELIEVDMLPTTTASDIPATTAPFGSAGNAKLTVVGNEAVAVLGTDVVLEPPPPPPHAGNKRKLAARISARRTLAS
jgi:hypothetical protein